ncbi:Tat pathway signal sequence domain protein [Streptomyces sp. NBC_00249]|uniref:Tat pathway signal sequence domain protein n=1 Tax=Streptomyces sp. NBC_00249 TaxID=2975690 RepID=UPI0022530911|nr:Tat pathway signal sequence domain protein [Streptomyces sp. NBC_00249]MCX5196649.1 Tat pathway signal sequence domain protein [Streptomyces sp. NBC_00249]
MSGGIGPVEPGDGTADREDREDPESHEGPRTAPRTPRAARAAAERLRVGYARHRRATLATAAALLLAASAARWYTTRPEPPVAPPPPAPSQSVSLTYLEPVEPTPPGAAFAFTVRVRNASGPAVSVERIAQPSPALSVTIRPPAPVTVAPGEARELTVLIGTNDCVHVARNSGLPFLEVTLSNGFQKEDHSYIPGDRYARDLSTALTRACPEDRDTPIPTPS